MINFLLKNSKLYYSSQAFKHNAPCKNNHCDNKIDPFNSAFTLMNVFSNTTFKLIKRIFDYFCIHLYKIVK